MLYIPTILSNLESLIVTVLVLFTLGFLIVTRNTQASLTVYLNLGSFFIQFRPNNDEPEGSDYYSDSQPESQEDQNNDEPEGSDSYSDSQPESQEDIPDLNDVPELDSPHLSSEGTEDRESGVDPRTSEIIDIIRQSGDIEGSREERSAWVREQFNQLMEIARQDVTTELDREGIEDPIQRAERIQEQIDTYREITLDRLENSDYDSFAHRDWRDLESNPEFGSESSEPEPQQPNQSLEAVASELESQLPNLSLEAVASEPEPQQPNLSPEAVASEQETSLPNKRKRSVSEDSLDEPTSKKLKETGSSLLDDYADPNTEMPSYMDPED